MSSSFDIILRTSILKLLVKCGWNEDHEVGLVRLLLSNTKLRYIMWRALYPSNSRVFVFLMYNFSWCAAPKFVTEKQWNISCCRYHINISDNNMYKRCNAEPISVRVDRNQWRILGRFCMDLVVVQKVLPTAYSSLLFVTNTLQFTERAGTPQTRKFSV